MTGWSGSEIWLIIVALGIATYTIRFSFLGLIGNRDGSLSLPHIASALVAVGVGYWRKNAVLAAVFGVLTFLAVSAIL
jgi:branched-subunit amino acid transport protein